METAGSTDRLLIVGARGGTNVGDSFARAARRLGMQHEFVEAGRAFAAPRLVRLVTWRLGGHRPPRLQTVSRNVVEACSRWRPRWLLSTGLAPVDASTLAAVGRMGVSRLNYLTDDPWNPGVRSRWFMHALREYDHVFSPRRANLDDLAQHGCAAVSYLPFGFDPELCFREEPTVADEWSDLAADVAFVGGADQDRRPFITALIHAGLHVALYGDYWGRYTETRGHNRGHADPATVRRATSAAKVSLCLVRRANRDGHVMRSLEMAAMGACMLVQDTDEHRALFGPHGDAAVYFRTIPEMLHELRWLLNSDAERRRLSIAVQRRIRQGRHTYDDRLRTMLAQVTVGV
jgi:spore maturation protein CgeB